MRLYLFPPSARVLGWRDAVATKDAATASWFAKGKVQP
jgi:hypothetical protein